MRRPQIVVFEPDARIAHVLSEMAAEKKWVLRESRQSEGCLRQLTGPGPFVLVVRLSLEAEASWDLLAQVVENFPTTRTVAVGDADSPPELSGLAWDLGADFALFPPMPLTRLPAIVGGLMDAL